MTTRIVVVALFAMLWLGQIAGAITSGHRPTAVWGLELPTSAVAGLAFLVILGLSVLAIFAFEAAAGIAAEAPPIAIFGAVTITAAVLLGRALTSSPMERSA